MTSELREVTGFQGEKIVELCLTDYRGVQPSTGIRMNKTRTDPKLIGQRAELLTELFLQDLEPEFVARPAESLGYDFFAGFRNPRGVVNIVAVEVEGTESSADFVMIPRTAYARWVNSNIPVLLLVVDVKESNYRFAWPDPEILNQKRSNVVKVPLTKMDDESRDKIRGRLAE